jgi:hypothetical protein
MVLKFLEEFREAVFLGVPMELILGDGKVSSSQTRVTEKKP